MNDLAAKASEVVKQMEENLSKPVMLVNSPQDKDIPPTSSDSIMSHVDVVKKLKEVAFSSIEGHSKAVERTQEPSDDGRMAEDGGGGLHVGGRRSRYQFFGGRGGGEPPDQGKNAKRVKICMSSVMGEEAGDIQLEEGTSLEKNKVDDKVFVEIPKPISQ